MTAFTYEPRATCICGARLIPTALAIRRAFAWGSACFRRCEACGSYVQAPQIDRVSLQRWYESDAYLSGATAYSNYLDDEASRRDEARGRLERDLRPFLAAPRRILEVGCATATLLNMLHQHGHLVTGVDLSARFAERARALYGIPVIASDFVEAALPCNSFDLVLMLGTISNLANLDAALAKVRSLLAAAGTFHFNFPRADSLTARLYGSRHWMFTASVSAFMTFEGCRLALARAGFHIVSAAIDVQRPSVGKFVAFSGLRRFADAGQRSRTPFPFSMPIPGVWWVVARPI
ncbi:MAG: class I SAM-dependent methyltransferase [Alphaproteobacteria bacterium]|nr:class I SAM-dependent methyltransferase [Alphaproteobacteria bacterium]